MREALSAACLQRVIAGVVAVASLIDALFQAEQLIEGPARIVVARSRHGLIPIEGQEEMASRHCRRRRLRSAMSKA